MDLTRSRYGRYFLLFGLVALIAALIEMGGFIGFGHQNNDPLNSYTHLQFGFGISFAFSRILAAVGIWMRAFWGVLVWILSVLSEIVLLIIWSDASILGLGTVSVHFIFFAVLLFLLFLVNRERHRLSGS